VFELAVKKAPNLAMAVVEVKGRLDAQGREVEPLDIDDDLQNQVEKWRRKGVDSCAIALMHAYAQPRHELSLKAWLQELGFGTVICSHQVCPLPRLVPRGQTSA